MRFLAKKQPARQKPRIELRPGPGAAGATADQEYRRAAIIVRAFGSSQACRQYAADGLINLQIFKSIAYETAAAAAGDLPSARGCPCYPRKSGQEKHV